MAGLLLLDAQRVMCMTSAGLRLANGRRKRAKPCDWVY